MATNARRFGIIGREIHQLDGGQAANTAVDVKSGFFRHFVVQTSPGKQI